MVRSSHNKAIPSNKSVRLRARAEAYLSAADHLELGWTVDPIEIQEGIKLAKHFHKMWERIANKADDLDVFAPQDHRKGGKETTAK